MRERSALALVKDPPLYAPASCGIPRRPLGAAGLALLRVSGAVARSIAAQAEGNPEPCAPCPACAYARAVSFPSGRRGCLRCGAGVAASDLVQ